MKPRSDVVLDWIVRIIPLPQRHDGDEVLVKPWVVVAATMAAPRRW